MLKPALAVLWAQYGPYHFARVAALQLHADSQPVHALEFASQTADYQWNRGGSSVNLITLCPGAVAETLSFWKVFFSTRRHLRRLAVKVCFLPSYWPKPSLAALLAAKSLGIGTVLMCESHAGTSRSRGLASWVKRRLARMFDAALVGGNPQKRYYESLGMPRENIFIGYDAVDNDYFARRAQEVRIQAAEIRCRYDLPQRYFLSLGRFVAKKNLATLIRSYRRFLDADSRPQTHLVMVGSGQEDTPLHALCRELQLPIYEHTGSGTEAAPPTSAHSSPGVHFYGFRQIDENPTFYALADAFILPSSWEEWGLVVNEAMCCGLPVVVSKTVGCAEDLLPPVAAGGAIAQPRATRLAQDRRQNGFVFDPGSVTALAESLLALDGDPGLRQQMGQASRSIIQDFSCDAFARNALLAAQVALQARYPLAPLAARSLQPRK